MDHGRLSWLFLIYCLVGSYISGERFDSLKTFLVNVFAFGLVIVSKFRPTIVTRSYVWCIIFVLSGNVLWTIIEVPKTIPLWELCVYISCTIILAIYPWFYASLAMSDDCRLKIVGCGENDRSFGTTKHGILFLPTYSTTMLLAYCVWNILFVIYWWGNISGLFHNAMAIVVAVVFALVEGNTLPTTVLFWAMARVLTLGCWIATMNMYDDDVGLLACNFSKLYQEVDVNGVSVYILIFVMLALTAIGVIELAWLYSTKEGLSKQEVGYPRLSPKDSSFELTIVRLNG